MKRDGFFRQCSIVIIFAWLLFFALLPFILVLAGSFLTGSEHEFLSWHFTLQNYADLFQLLYLRIFLRSFYLAGITAIICLILAYPFAYIMSRFSESARLFWMLILIIPFWTNSLMRIYSIIIVIRVKGWLNGFLLWAGLIHQPLHLMYTQTASLIGLVYTLLPFMILPLYANLEKFNWTLLDAARDLGAKQLRRLFKIVIPLTLPGIIAGMLLVLLPAMTIFYVPDILGGAKSLLLGNLIKNQFIEAYNWPLGCAVSVMLTIVMVLMIAFYWKMTTPKERRELM
ncbi:MAG: ABC transporter permease subunit [Pseudomonadota bacterium]